MLYDVENLKEGSRPGDWLKYWESQAGEKAGTCHRLGCSEDATDGAHVQLVDSVDRNWYIVPLCHQCNCQFGHRFRVTGPLVPVDPKNKILK